MVNIVSNNDINHQKRITIYDVARECGVSKSTVSMVLTGDKRVNSKTVDRVREAITKTGYQSQQNQSARRLVLMKYDRVPLNNTIAIIIPGEFMDDPYHQEIFHGVWTVLKNSGLDLIIINQEAILDSNKSISTCIARGDVDGVIIVESMESQAQKILERLRLEFGFGQKPVVTTMVDIPDAYSVVPNAIIGSKQATEYLLHNGHRHILQLSPNYASYQAKPRLEGISEGYKSYNLQADNYLTVRYIDGIWLNINSNIIPSAIMFKDIYRHSEEEIIPYLAAHPEITAILAWNDPCAIHLINLLSSSGISVPEQISVIGHDDTFPLIDKTGNNQLTTIKIPLLEIGKTAGQLICNLTKDEPTDNIPRVLPTNLVIRKSTEKYREVI